jgi:phosphoribosylpyrophosphate synthetase
VIVARNPASAKKANSYAERLRVGIAVIHGEMKECDLDEIDGRYSPPPVPRSGTIDVGGGLGLPTAPNKEKPPLHVVGDVQGLTAIMVVGIS